MKIAYVTTYDVCDRNQWPRQHLGLYGAGQRIFQLLQDSGAEVTPLGPLPPKKSPVTRLKWLAYRHGFQRDYYSWADPIVQRHYRRQIRQRLRRIEPDLVLCPENAIPIARLRTPQPLVLWTDALLGSLVDFYPYLSNLCGETRRQLHRLEQSALESCDRIILTSDWAVESACRLYRLDPAKVRVVPRGANQERQISAAELETLLVARPERPCRLLFMGVDWQRKGGPLAVEVARQLHESGVDTELRLVGCRPKTELPPYVKVEGFIDRSNPEGQARFEDILSTSHFLLLPTQADTFGIALSEASAFGVPCLATQVGGIPTIIRDHRNGHSFPLDAPAAAYADFIRQYLEPAAYRPLARSTYSEFHQRLSWGAAQDSIQRYLQELL